MPFQFSQLSQEQFPLVNRFYKANGHKGKARGNETLYVMRETQDIIAAVRLCPKRDGWLLRSLWVAKSRRGEGIGTMLLHNVLATPEHHPCWCYPYDHLKAFYQAAGFQQQPADEAPEQIREPFEAYQAKGNHLLLMTSQKH